MPFCDQCRNEIRNTATFCDQCGSPVRSEQPASVPESMPSPSNHVQTTPSQPRSGPFIVPETRENTTPPNKRKFLKWGGIGCSITTTD